MIGLSRPSLGHAATGPVLTPFPGLPLLSAGGGLLGTEFGLVFEIAAQFQTACDFEACFDPDTPESAEFDLQSDFQAHFDPDTDLTAEYDTAVSIDADTEGEQ